MKDTQNVERDEAIASTLRKIVGLSRMGYAASDTNMTLDLSAGGHQEQYEMITDLAESALNTLDL